MALLPKRTDAMDFTQLYSWSVPPTKYRVDLSSARARRKHFRDSFTYLRAERQPEFCPAWVQGATIGWRIASPVDISFSPVEQTEIAWSDDPSISVQAVGMNQVWKRENTALAVKPPAWMSAYEFETTTGSQSMFIPNGLGTVEWRLGWRATSTEAYGLLVILSPECSDLGVEIGFFSGKTIDRLNDIGFSIAIAPTTEFSLQRGDEIARLIPISKGMQRL